MGADGLESRRLEQTDHLVRALHACDRVGAADRRRDDHAFSPQTACDAARLRRGRARRDSVIHDEGEPALERLAGMTRPDQRDSRRERRALGALDAVDLRRSDSQAVDEVVVEQSRAVLADRAHGHLRLRGDAEFAYDDDIQGCSERCGHLGGDRHPATRKSEHDGVLAAHRVEPRGEPSPRIDPVPEHLPHPRSDAVGVRTRSPRA
jgi:hypothetical protein